PDPRVARRGLDGDARRPARAAVLRRLRHRGLVRGLPHSRAALSFGVARAGSQIIGPTRPPAVHPPRAHFGWPNRSDANSCTLIHAVGATTSQANDDAKPQEPEPAQTPLRVARVTAASAAELAACIARARVPGL